MFEAQLSLTEELLRAGGLVLLDLRESDLDARQKRSQSDIVTVADLSSEKTMLELLDRHAPNDGVLSEELGFRAGSSEDVWVIDPLDGTANYASGLDEFGVIVGLTRNGRPIVGGMYLPTLDVVYLASAGGGASRNGSSIHVSSTRHVQDAIFDHSLDHLDAILDEQSRTLETLIRTARGVRCVHSLYYLARVAEGAYDGFVYHSLGLWDICGPSVILTEAGGQPASLNGSALDLAPSPRNADRLFAVAGANPALLQELLELLGLATD